MIFSTHCLKNNRLVGTHRMRPIIDWQSYAACNMWSDRRVGRMGPQAEPRVDYMSDVHVREGI